MDVPVMDIMTTKLVCVKPSDLVIDAVNKMVKQGLGNVLVVDGNDLKGIVTEKDILTKVVAKDISPKNIKVSDIMTKKVITAKPTATLREVNQLMIDSGIRRLPVKDKGRIIGIVTDRDLLRVEPGLIDLMLERMCGDSTPLANSGMCDICNSYSRKLFVADKMLVCSKCKKEI